MKLIKAIKDRRSIRQYKNKDIKKDLILDILNCGILAPSAKNRQPWEFIVLQGENKDKVADIMSNYLTDQNISDDKKIFKTKNSVNPTAEAIKRGSVLILILRENEKEWTIGDSLSVGACVQNMCLRATDLGLGSLWIRDTVYADKYILEFVKQEGKELNCALLLGFPNEKPKQRPRKSVEDKTIWF